MMIRVPGSGEVPSFRSSATPQKQQTDLEKLASRILPDAAPNADKSASLAGRNITNETGSQSYVVNFRHLLPLP